MARCGCGSSCSCLIEAGDGTRVDGIGTVENPYVISADASQLLEQMEFLDTSTVDFETTGLGTLGSPMLVSAVATLAMTDLIDVVGSPELSQVPVWVGDHWEFQDQTGGGGGGSGLPDGGTTGQTLIKASAADGDADWETMVTDYVTLRANVAQSMVSSGETSMIFHAAVSDDPLGMWDGSTLVTVQRDGIYRIVANYSYAAQNPAAGSRITLIRINGATYKQWYHVHVNSVIVSGTLSFDVKLLAGNTVQLRQYQSSGGALDTAAATMAYGPTLSVVRMGDLVGGSPLPEPVMGEKNYAAQRTQGASVAVAASTPVKVPWDSAGVLDSITYDGTGVFTVPVAGYYDISASVIWDSALTTGYRQIRIYVNGAGSSAVNMAGNNGNVCTEISRVMLLAAGDTVQINVYSNTGPTSLVAAGANNFVSITKVPAPVVPGRAASGVWGAPPLDGYGVSSLAGVPIYVDEVGQLRSRPDYFQPAPAYSAAGNLPQDYPPGISNMMLNTADATAGGWPGQGSVLTIRRTDNQAQQIWMGGNSDQVKYRSGDSGWRPWVQWSGTGIPFATASGVVTMPAVAANAGSSQAVTFPAGRFSVAPVVTVAADSNGYGAGSVGSVTATGFTAKYYNPTASVPSSPRIFWTAVQMTPTAAAG